MMKRHGKQKGDRLVGPVEQVTTEQLPAKLAAMGWKETLRGLHEGEGVHASHMGWKETEVPGQGQSTVYTNPAHPGAEVWTATTTRKAGVSWGHYENNEHEGRDLVQSDLEYAGAGKEHRGTATGLVHYLSGLRALDEIATLERVWALPARGPA
jgi:hypothetical protein